MTIEFSEWPKTPRWFRDITITEKIDGTNGGIHIREFTFGHHAAVEIPKFAKLVMGQVQDDSGLPVHEYLIAAQSRKRLVTPADDNQGFARWVWNNADHLIGTLGAGTHYGEWWGQGIQRNYGANRKAFSLFNTHKWGQVLDEEPDAHGLAVVPRLYQGPNDAGAIDDALDELRDYGSFAAPGFDRPEGIVIYHSAARQVFKVLIESDDVPKSLAVVVPATAPVAPVMPLWPFWGRFLGRAA